MSNVKKWVYGERVFSALPGQVVQLAGQRFGYLTVLSRAGRKAGYVSWLCRCDCGTEIEVPGNKLRAGRRKSCNIGHRFIPPLGPPTLRQQYPSELQSWAHMHDRCKNPKYHRFPHYGGRGIKICERWASFENFMLDMGKKPDPKFTIERDNVNLDYEPGNCRWISRAEQSRNRTDTVFVTYQRKRMKLIDVVGELGLSRGVVYGRLKMGWPLDVAIALPIRHYKK